MARPRLSTAEKKLKGTYRQDRAGNQDENEQAVSTTCFSTDTQLEIPTEITDPYVSEYYKYHTNQLISLHLLSPTDLPELNMMYFTLQQLRQIQKKILETELSGDIDTYERLTKLSIKLGNRFSQLAAKYYISPVARTKIQLDALVLEQKKNEAKSAIGKLISKKAQ